MTVLVAARCTDGIVVGADSISTSAAGPHRLIQMRSDDKIRIVGDRVIIAGTGSVGLGQRFERIVDYAWTSKFFAKTWHECCNHIATLAVNDFNSTGTPRNEHVGFGFGAILAAPISDKCELVEFGLLDMQPERKTSRLNFVSMGSGQLLADPFLAFVSRVLWKGGEPSVELAKFGVYWALAHAIAIAPGGVGPPIQIGVLRREKGQWRARLLLETEMGELAQHITEIENRISQYPIDSIESATPSQPPTPKIGTE